MMYRQRLFMETSPKLIEGFHSAEPGGFKTVIVLDLIGVVCVVI